MNLLVLNFLFQGSFRFAEKKCEHSTEGFHINYIQLLYLIFPIVSIFL